MGNGDSKGRGTSLSQKEFKFLSYVTEDKRNTDPNITFISPCQKDSHETCRVRDTYIHHGTIS